MGRSECRSHHLQIFCRCLVVATQEQWDVTFKFHVREYTNTVLGANALRNQNTQKPENMSVKQWINRLMNKNSYLPLLQQNTQL